MKIIMKNFKYIYLLLLGSMIAVTGCVKDLEVEPIDPNAQTSDKTFNSVVDYKLALAKIYASYAISGQTGGGGGNPDIQGIDENFGNYLRQYWGLQELSTDEAIMAWDDATIKNFHWQTWAPNDVFISALYSRIFYSVTLVNEFIRTSTEGINTLPASDKDELELYQVEARFLRALSYWHAIDMFGNVPFVTEADKPGNYYPPRISRNDLFDYIESELKAIENLLGPAGPGAHDYAAANQASAWMLLSKLYLNAEVYIGEKRYTEALTYLNKVLDAGYSIDPDYMQVFAADNHVSDEIIYAIAFDGINTQQYGGMTFVLHASNGGGMPLYGIDGGWGGIRAIKELPEKFGVQESDFSSSEPEYVPSDSRARFFFNDSIWVWDVINVGTFTDGIGVTKFRNVTTSGDEAPNAHPAFVSTDFPMFRLADTYLMYAEAVLRGGEGGDFTTALGFINELRYRAYGDNSGDISMDGLTLPFILDERARELYWECHRRTDLIRFNQFTENGVWTWKGNTLEGKTTESYRNLYPIPSSDLNANPNLKQNDGYLN